VFFYKKRVKVTKGQKYEKLKGDEIMDKKVKKKEDI